jgi:tetratricopeptide (TPR) repeat protein
VRRTIPALAALLFLALQSLSAQTKADALALYREGRYAEAIDVCVAEIAANPASVESHVVLCWSLVMAKRYEEADSWAEKGRALSKYDPRLVEIQAEAKYYKGQNEQSLRLFRITSVRPNGGRMARLRFMGEIYFSRRDTATPTSPSPRPFSSSR